eukprot:1046160-Rhodomonas_salina.3
MVNVSTGQAKGNRRDATCEANMALARSDASSVPSDRKVKASSSHFNVILRVQASPASFSIVRPSSSRTGKSLVTFGFPFRSVATIGATGNSRNPTSSASVPSRNRCRVALTGVDCSSRNESGVKHTSETSCPLYWSRICLLIRASAAELSFKFSITAAVSWKSPGNGNPCVSTYYLRINARLTYLCAL